MNFAYVHGGAVCVIYSFREVFITSKKKQKSTEIPSVVSQLNYILCTHPWNDSSTCLFPSISSSCAACYHLSIPQGKQTEKLIRNSS